MEETKHIEEHSLLIKCKDRESMLKVIDGLKFVIGGFNDWFTVDVIADYDIYYTKKEE